MKIPASRWVRAISKRRSRRQFDPRPVDSELLKSMQMVCTEFRPFPPARAVMVAQSPGKVFTGAIGRYGKVKGASAFVAFIGDMNSPNIQEMVGYLGEGIILEATALNLATCWVGGFFRPEVAASLAGARESERVLAVTPIGYPRNDWSLEERIMASFGRNHRRKPLAELVSGLEEMKWPHWMKLALDAARLAPSAVNRQPWRFHLDHESIALSVDNLQDTFHGIYVPISKRLDCGIAMLHLEVALLNNGIRGEWGFLTSPYVARFRVSGMGKIN